MANEAKLKNIPPEGFEGGIIVEMSIQSDLQFKKRKGTIQLVGFIDCTPESIIIDLRFYTVPLPFCPFSNHNCIWL
jgi:hypothetical protein